jgi:hypothetical protein
MDENGIYDPDLALKMFTESPTFRGAWVTMQDLYNRQTKLDRSTWKRDPNPLRSLLLWYYDETAPVTRLMFEVKAQGESACDGGNPDGNLADCPDFNLAFSFSSCIEIALKWANGQPIMMDATHGTNNLGCTMTTLLAVDGHGNGHPIAWFFTKHETSLSSWKHSTWRWGPMLFMPSSFLGSLTSMNAPMLLYCHIEPSLSVKLQCSICNSPDKRCVC